MSAAVEWQPDILGEGYEQTVFELGPDPDGQGDVRAVLVRRVPRAGEDVRGAVLYVHGFADYFFQTELAERVAATGRGFYGLDLRRCGCSIRPGQHPHHVTDTGNSP